MSYSRENCSEHVRAVQGHHTNILSHELGSDNVIGETMTVRIGFQWSVMFRGPELSSSRIISLCRSIELSPALCPSGSVSALRVSLGRALAINQIWINFVWLVSFNVEGIILPRTIPLPLPKSLRFNIHFFCRTSFIASYSSPNNETQNTLSFRWSGVVFLCSELSKLLQYCFVVLFFTKRPRRASKLIED